MTRILSLLLTAAIFLSLVSDEFVTPYEQSGKTHSATHSQAISYYQKLDAAYPQIKLIEYGKTDVGRPLHLVVVSKDEVFDPACGARKRQARPVYQQRHSPR